MASYDQPDYYPTIPTVTVKVAPGVATFYYITSVTLPPGTYTDLTILQVGDDEYLHIALINLSTDSTVQNEIALYDHDTIFYKTRYKELLIVPFPLFATYGLPQGHIFKVRLYNRDTAEKTFDLVLHGTYEVVPQPYALGRYDQTYYDDAYYAM